MTPEDEKKKPYTPEYLIKAIQKRLEYTLGGTQSGLAEAIVELPEMQMLFDGCQALAKELAKRTITPAKVDGAELGETVKYMLENIAAHKDRETPVPNYIDVPYTMIETLIQAATSQQAREWAENAGNYCGPGNTCVYLCDASNPCQAREPEHCKDCCCARSWKALGVTEYTGKSIAEHIETLSKAAMPNFTEDELLAVLINNWSGVAASPDDRAWFGNMRYAIRALAAKGIVKIREGK